MKIFGLMKIADIFTVGNLCCGILSILLAIDGLFDLSALLLLLAGVFDVLDGKIAGLLHHKESFRQTNRFHVGTGILWRCSCLDILFSKLPGVLDIVVS